jgi:hypothetical protein
MGSEEAAFSVPGFLDFSESLRRPSGKAAMSQVKSVADWMAEQDKSLAALIEASGLDRRVVESIVRGQYTPSPQQRQRLAEALGVSSEQIAWGHQVEVAHVYGHGPQFGRSP